jgi:hypothetical protein
MRHAGLEALSTLTDLLSAIRARGPKKPRLGIFYRKGKAWLHFHEDKAGLFADLRVNAEWERFRVSEAEEHANLLMLIDRSLQDGLSAAKPTAERITKTRRPRRRI